jgi:hypothetical protein
MFRKVKPEKIAGIVALSYLVLIPAGAAIAWRRIKYLEQDVDEMAIKVGMPDIAVRPLIDTDKLQASVNRVLGRR